MYGFEPATPKAWSEHLTTAIPSPALQAHLVLVSQLLAVRLRLVVVLLQVVDSGVQPGNGGLRPQQVLRQLVIPATDNVSV